MVDAPTPGGLLAAYAREIEPDLYGTWRTRRRILAEVINHLEETVVRLESEGMARRAAEAHAIRRFGSPEIVARAFAHSKGVGVATRFTRIAGLSGIVGTLILTAAGQIAEYSESFSHGAFAEIALTGAAFFAVGLVGMYLRARGNLGRYGRIGFRLMLGGFVVGMVLGSLWFAPGAFTGLTAMVIGVALFLVALWRANVFPKTAVALLIAALIVGVVVGFAGLAIGVDTGPVAGGATNLLTAIGICMIGLHLWGEHPEAEHDEGPPIAAA